MPIIDNTKGFFRVKKFKKNCLFYKKYHRNYANRPMKPLLS